MSVDDVEKSKRRDFDPNACSREAQGKPILPYLWCRGGLCYGTEERIVEDGHFSVQLIGYWQKKPTVTRNSSWDVNYRFMNEDQSKNKQWVSVEFMDPPENVSTDGDIGKWVEFSVMFSGKPMLNIPDNQNYTVLKFVRIKDTDQTFIAKHQLRQMASFIGTIKLDDTVCCVYLVLMQKGRKSWKMEVVFPASYQKGPVEPGNRVSSPIVNNDEDLAKIAFHPINSTMAGLWIGHFKILD